MCRNPDEDDNIELNNNLHLVIAYMAFALSGNLFFINQMR